LDVSFFNDANFATPELTRFVSRSSIFKAPMEARVFFEDLSASVKLQRQASNVEYFEVTILPRDPNPQLSSVAQICATSSPLLSTMENLVIYEPVNSKLDWRYGIENTEWLELLLLFPAVKDLYLSKRIAPRIVAALQEITGGGTTGVLPTLQNLYLEGFEPSEPVQEGIARFISARQFTTHPVAISVWDRPFVEDGSEDDDELEEDDEWTQWRTMIANERVFIG
jgi:hypothetical protein